MQAGISDMLKKVRQIEIRTNRQVSDALAGAYHSIFKGRGMDFEESREYQVGDEIRSIDWNVTARTGKAHVKRYTEERELTMMLMVDLSASGLFGSSLVSKRERMAEIASTLAFSAVRNGDKVGLALFTDSVELMIAPRKGRRHILRLIRDILFYEPKSAKTDIAACIDEVNRVVKRRAIMVVVSDFLQGKNGMLPTDDNGEVVRALSLTNRRHDLICASVSDPREFELPNVGTLFLEDAESGECVQIDTSSAKVRKAYSDYNFIRKSQFEKQLAKVGIDLLEVDTTDDYIFKLKKFFETRKSKR